MTTVFEAPPHWATEAIVIELVGCGGTGSAMLDELYRMHSLLTELNHPGLRIRAWDGDSVAKANVGRQRFWPADVGWNKAELLIARYNNFGDTDWLAEPVMLNAKSCKHTNADVIISCVDSPEVRVMIGETGKACGANPTRLWLDTGNDANSGQVILGHWCGREHLSNGLPNVLDLYPSLRVQRSDGRPSCSTEEALQRQDFGINQRVAGEASGLMWQLVRYGKLDRHGSFIYQQTGEVWPLAISEELWRTFEAA